MSRVLDALCGGGSGALGDAAGALQKAVCSISEEDLMGGVVVLLRGAEEGRWEVGAKVVGRRSEDVFYISYVFSIPCNINLF